MIEKHAEPPIEFGSRFPLEMLCALQGILEVVRGNVLVYADAHEAIQNGCRYLCFWCTEYEEGPDEVPNPENNHTRRAYVALNRALHRFLDVHPDLDLDETGLLGLIGTVLERLQSDLVFKQAAYTFMQNVRHEYPGLEVTIEGTWATDVPDPEIVGHFLEQGVTELQKVRIPDLRYS